jgi:nickel-dependent lactate racemase
MKVPLRYGTQMIEMTVPADSVVLRGAEITALSDPLTKVRQALDAPIDALPLTQLIASARPRSVAITISDITRPVPNKVLLPPIFDVLNENGVADDQIVIIIATGMHRPSSAAERDAMLGAAILQRCEVIDHMPGDPAALEQVADDPPVSINKRFLDADFKIVTGLIEPHFMAGYSGGRKGICPGLVDLATVQRFHGSTIMAHPDADSGILEGNPCHEEGLRIARIVGCDFLVNVAITHDRDPAGIYCGDLEQAHLIGCQRVGQWTEALVEHPFDLLITNGGGNPLDATFYQTVKGMVGALPAMGPQSTQLIIAQCDEGIGSPEFTSTMMRWGQDWSGFLKHIAATETVDKDQWQFQMMAKVLARIGSERLRLVTDGLDVETLGQLGVNPILGQGDAPTRCQRFIDQYVRDHPVARIAVIPEGPYTMLIRTARR